MNGDGRHDFLIEAPKEPATVLWDRHDLIFVEGNLDAWVLTTLEFQRGELAV
ncbi:MAG: hypothetical protein IPL30_07940 [Elusimicrobia bacterium]|nr:hypothetical protein [Elusimicrobiota bacterium]